MLQRLAGAFTIIRRRIHHRPARCPGWELSADVRLWVPSMAERYLLTNARVITPERIIEGGTVVVEAGLIGDVIDHSFPSSSEALDLAGRLLLPGLIDLHNDALEREIMPRPGGRFDTGFALLHLDRKLAAAGVTTQFHAVYFADRDDIGRSVSYAGPCAKRSPGCATPPTLPVDNQVLHRIDLRTAKALDTLLDALSFAATPFISLNDHVPGQGQFRDLDAYRRYVRGLHTEMSEEQLDAIVAGRLAHASDTEEVVAALMGRLSVEQRRRGLIVASHDDDTAERVDLMRDLGCTIAEFPVTLVAAERASAFGMLIAMGAPNALRGRSLTGNASAIDLLERGLVDILVADYHAPALLAAVFRIVELGLADLPSAVRLVTENPARAVELRDRGALRPGMRADLLIAEVYGATRRSPRQSVVGKRSTWPAHWRARS